MVVVEMINKQNESMDGRGRRKNSATNSTTVLLLAIVMLLLIVIIILLFGYTSGFGMMNGISSMMGIGMFSGMMNGGYGSMMGSTGAINITQISINTTESYATAIPHYAQKYTNNDTLLFSSNNITLIVIAMGIQRAINLTHEQPPSYDSNSSGNAFVIYGLINPTLIIPKGAVVHVEFINLDSSEYHNVIMTASGPPYQYMPMSAMNGIVSMMPIIPHANYPSNSALEYNYTTVFENSGTYWYICMYPGHAQMGMYGKIIVE